MHYEAILYASGAATVLSVLLSGYAASRHLASWNHPGRQRRALVIIAMAPLFAVDSLAGLLELEEGESMAHLLDTVKECYEAACLHAFLGLMYEMAGLGGDVVAGRRPLPDGMKGRELHVPFPLGALYGHARFDARWVGRLRLWTGQFLLLRPVLSTLDLLFVDLHPVPASGLLKILIVVALNVSVTTAFYALLTFYHAFESELAKDRPLAKFLSIKGVVFFATWQGVVLKLLAHFGILHEGLRFSVDEIELAYQDMLVCLEMGLIFSPLAVYAFPPPSKDKKAEIEMKEKKTK